MTRPLFKHNKDWQVATLEARSTGEVITEVGSGGTPPTEKVELWGGTILWLTPKELTAEDSYRYLTSTERTITSKGLEKAGRLWPSGTVMLTKRAPVGYVAINQIPMATNQGILNFRCGKGLYPEFLYYWLLGNTLYLDAVANGSTFPELYPSDLFEFEICLPPLPEQRAIAHILGTLDDKIELNRRMNQTLEAMAQALFKSWFVGFEPFRDQGMQDSSLGEIPVGWEVLTLCDVATIHDSQRIPLSGRERAQRKGIYPYYGATSIMDYIDDYIFDGIYVLMAEDGSVAEDNDHPVVQYVWGKFWVNNHAHVLQGSNGVSTEHLLLFLNQLNIHPYVTGAVQPKLNQENMCRIPFILPPPHICSLFRERITPIYSLFRANLEQMNILTAIRDMLLPKLLSGEIRVKDAEKFVESEL